MSFSLETPDAKPRYKRLVTTQNGKSERILQQSVCSILETCGRCRLLDLPYHQQVYQKTEKTKDFLKKIGSIYQHVSVKDCVEAPEKLAYRHSVHLMVSEQAPSRKEASAKTRRIDIGFYQPSFKHVIDIGRCPIQNIHLNHIIAWIRTGIRIHKVSIQSKSNPSGILDSIILTATHTGNQIFLCFVVSKLHSASLRPLACDIASKFSNIRGIFMRTREDTENKNVKLLTGHTTLKENLNGITREKSVQDFFPANPAMTEKILKRIIELQTSYEKNYKFSIVSANPSFHSVLKCLSLTECLIKNPEIICLISSLSQSVEEMFHTLEKNDYFPLFVEPFDMLPGTDYVEALTVFLKRT